MNKHEWSKTMSEYAQTLPTGTARAQAYNIASKLKMIEENFENIADMMVCDHNNISSSLRHSHLLVNAGLGLYKENERDPAFFGEFEFIDGSVLNSHS